MERPSLPRHRNADIQLMDLDDLPPVKYQVLTCQGTDILVGRMKVPTPTPSGHAFILRRYDTGAISLTTMFRAAYPNATDQEEKREVNWIKENYDLVGNNGSGKEPHITRLAGTWVSPELAVELARLYHLENIMDIVVEAQPDPWANYRRSGKSTAAGQSSPQAQNGATGKSENDPPVRRSAAKSLPTPSPTTAPTPAKRRKESSPAPQAADPEASPIKPTRRSNRTKSPAPRSAPMPPITSVSKPQKMKRTSRKAEPLEEHQDNVAEEGDTIIHDVATAELHRQDIQEQQEMIADLKAQRDAAMKVSQEDDEEVVDGVTKLKRTREEIEVPPRFDFKETEEGERAIVTNKRVGAFQRLQPQQKSIVWGAAAFSLGLAAMTFLPNFF